MTEKEPKTPPRSGLLEPLFRRVAAHWVVKWVYTTIALAVFFVCYFWILRHPFRPPVTMPLTAVDRWVEFRPEALPLYVSLWLYVSLAPTFLVSLRELLSYLVGSVVLAAVGLVIFYFWPTTAPIPDLDWTQHPSFSFLKSIDASGNACPSLHVAFAVFSAFWLDRLLREVGGGAVVKGLNWLWCLGIIYSTMAIRQHVWLDAVAGSALGSLVGWVHLRFHPNPLEKPPARS